MGCGVGLCVECSGGLPLHKLIVAIAGAGFFEVERCGGLPRRNGGGAGIGFEGCLAGSRFCFGFLRGNDGNYFEIDSIAPLGNPLIQLCHFRTDRFLFIGILRYASLTKGIDENDRRNQ